MKTQTTSKAALFAILIGSLFAGGCASSGALRAAIADREAEIRELREQKITLSDRLQTLTHERDNLASSLEDAARLAERNVGVTPAAAPAQVAPVRYDDLDNLGVGYGVRDGRMVITLPSSISFPSGKAELSAQGKQALQAVARRLKNEFPNGTFHIEGHTDSDPISRSAFGSNRQLSLARAMAVLSYMVEVCEIRDKRFVVAGHGEYKPLASNDSAEGKAKNRRVEIVVHGRQ